MVTSGHKYIFSLSRESYVCNSSDSWNSYNSSVTLDYWISYVHSTTDVFSVPLNCFYNFKTPLLSYFMKYLFISLVLWRAISACRILDAEWLLNINIGDKYKFVRGLLLWPLLGIQETISNFMYTKQTSFHAMSICMTEAGIVLSLENFMLYYRSWYHTFMGNFVTSMKIMQMIDNFIILNSSTI